MNAEAIVSRLQELGFDASVSHTGGGCFTIFVGEPNAEGYYPTAVGPFYLRDGEYVSDEGDCYVGPDDSDDPNGDYIKVDLIADAVAMVEARNMLV
jgi:hypothetical protein